MANILYKNGISKKDKLASSRGYCQVIMESDSLSAIQFIEQGCRRLHAAAALVTSSKFESETSDYRSTHHLPRVRDQLGDLLMNNDAYVLKLDDICTLWGTKKINKQMSWDSLQTKQNRRVPLVPVLFIAQTPNNWRRVEVLVSSFTITKEQRMGKQN
ncbi:hypothetical protein VNO77_42148 [Canavalia gladiata]|uniref:Uncharacterized protein n=1 Tax=Canavalia gladiata TaxID=3824 RepID=A0AAN9K051_CANGL